MNTNTSAWAQQCPLCGQANQCAVAQGLPAEQCWCMSSAVSAEALARLPTQERGQRCICPSCGQVTTPPNGAAATPTTASTPDLR